MTDITDIPTSEPRELRAGDTWKWRREDLSSTPAPTWTLKYEFKNSTGAFQVTAAADGANHAVTVAKATTATFAAGRYRWVAFVDDGTERYSIGTGEIEVLRNFDDDAVLDVRSHAKKVLDAIEAVLENRATLDQQNYTIGNRSLARTPIPDLLLLRDRYRAEVTSQQIVAGLPNPRRAYVRFGRA